MLTHQDISIYRQLQQHLDKLPIGFPPTESGVELEILEHFFSEEEAQLALCLYMTNTKARVVKKRMSSRHGVELTEEETVQKLETLFMKGSINRGGKKAPFGYSNAMLAIGMFEFSVDHLEPGFIEKMRIYLDGAFGEEFFSSTFPQLRTSPHLKAVIPEHIIDTYDNMKSFVKRTKEPIAVANCVCKQGEEIQGKPCKQVDDIEICLLIGGEGHIAREQARIITKEECLAILDRAEESGLVLQPGNTRDPFCICLCCGCCCGVITTAKKMKDPAQYFASNYYARIIEDNCTGCGLCIKRCQMDAITLMKERKKVELDLNRCIGCGLCVTKCPTGAAVLEKKENNTVPPHNIALLYLNILRGKVGRKKMILSMFNMLTGRKI